MVPPQEALGRLRDGNSRFRAGTSVRVNCIDDGLRRRLLAQQRPFATVLGCSDSRVPPEIVFDQAPGDLFVVRVAGNVAAPTAVGSVEFAVTQLGCRLVLVLGHTNCGAVVAAVNDVRNGESVPSCNLRGIVDEVRQAVASLVRDSETSFNEHLLEQAVRANVRYVVNRLQELSPTLRRAVEEQRVLILGAEYSLATGAVEFLEQEAAER